MAGWIKKPVLSIYTYFADEVYILCHLKYIFFEKGSYTVIIYSFAILGQSAKIPIKTCFTAQPLKMIPVTSKQAHPIIFLEYPNI